MRLLVAATLLALFAVPSAGRGPAAPPDAPADAVKMDEKTKAAVDRGLRWLKDQQAADGSWGGQAKVAMTAFAVLAYLANGHAPNQGDYGKEVARGVRYLCACTKDDGYVLNPGGGNMYCHGMATLALSQAFGMSADEEVKKCLKRAVDLIIRTQNHEGGWRYDPAPTGADISVTIMQMMALRGAKDGGLQVPDRVMDEAVKYVNRCYDRRSGGYRYQPYSPGAGFARTAAGVCVLQLRGEYDADDITKAVEYLDRTGDDPGHYWYGHYYAAHALNQVGGEVWEKYYARMTKTLLARQKDGGEWYDQRREHQYGPVYSTAIAVLILSVPTHYLPIYQK